MKDLLLSKKTLQHAWSLPKIANSSLTLPLYIYLSKQYIPFRHHYLKPILSCCASGGVGLSLLVVLVCYRVFRRKKVKESERQKEEEKESSTVVNHNVNHLDVNEKRRDVFLQANSTRPWDGESLMVDTRLESHGGQFRSRADEDSSHFRCPDCSTKGQRGIGPTLMRWNNRINTEMEADEDREKSTMRMVTEQERRKAGTQQGILSRDIRYNTNFSSQSKRETLSEKPENLSVCETGRDMDSYRINVEGKSTGYETLHCESCHRTYRPPQQSITPGRFESNIKDSAVFNGFPPQHRWIDKGRNHNQFDMMKNTELRRETRNVTFDLESLRILEQGNSQGKGKRDEEVRTSRDKEKEREKRAKIQSSRLLKVKLNLNPLRKSKVHPKKKNEQDHTEKGRSKKSNDKRQRGKDRQEKGGKEKSGNKTKGSGEKLKKSTKSRRSSDDSLEQKEKQDRGEGKHKKTNSENEQTVQEEDTQPDNSQSGDTTNTTDQSTPAVATGQVQNSQGGSVQFQGTGLVLGSPFSLSAAESNHTTNLPLLGSTGSQMTGSRLSLQGGNFLLNNMAPRFKALFPSGPTNSVAPSIAISGPNLASSGALDSSSRQTGVGLMSPATSLLANSVHANSLQASATQTTPLHNSQATGLALSLAANPVVNPEPIQSLFQTQLPPDSSSLLARLKSDPVQGPGLQTGEGLHQMIPESQAPQIRESLPVQFQPTDVLSVVTSQALGSETTVENLSNTQTETGRVPALLTSAGSAVLAEGPAAGAPGDSMRAADVPVSDVSGDAADAAVLLRQEYLSEEGDSSPRRKLRLALPEKTSSQPPTALERKIR